jgi:hypothetical protein
MSRTASVVVIAAIFTFAAAKVRAQSLPATFCMPMNTDSGDMYRVSGQVGNASTLASMWVECPMIFFANPPISVSIGLTIGSSGSSYQFPCRFAGYTDNKAGWWTALKYQCSTAGGCSTATVAGANNHKSIAWSYPLGTSVISTLWNAAIECIVPSDGGDALIVTYGGH